MINRLVGDGCSSAEGGRGKFCSEAPERKAAPSLNTFGRFHPDLGDQPHPCCHGNTSAKTALFLWQPAQTRERERKKCKQGFGRRSK